VVRAGVAGVLLVELRGATPFHFLRRRRIAVVLRAIVAVIPLPFALATVIGTFITTRPSALSILPALILGRPVRLLTILSFSPGALLLLFRLAI
jgi:hypothetical protein